MKYVVAVSGGIDSVVLLDMLVSDGSHELTVAHFDHGIRPDSAADARFVEALARQYKLPFVSKREELGAGASEELARTRRYDFLRAEAKKRDAQIVTAHHSDDVIETIAINLLRGTGWRGLAVLNGADIVRPLLNMSKNEIRTYARDHRLEWVEDSTNAGTDYLRNRVRRRSNKMLPEATKQKVLEKWQRQLALKTEIDTELASYVRVDNEYERYFFIQVEPVVATEVLRTVFMAALGVGLTRPQIERALLVIKTARPGAISELGGGVTVRFTTTTFIVQTP